MRDSLVKLIETTADQDTLKVIYYHQLSAYLINTNINESDQFARRALFLAEKQNYKRGTAMAHQIISEYYNARGLYEKALSSQIKALTIFEKLGDFKKASIVSNSTGNTYLGLNNLKKALEFYQLSASQAERAKSNFAIAIAKVGIGNVFSRLGKHKASIAELGVAKKIFEWEGKELQSAFVYANMAESFISLNESDSADFYAQKALTLMQKYNNRYGTGFTNLVLGNIDLARKKYNSSLNYYFKALQIAEEDEAIDNQKEICFQIYKLFEEKGNTTQAYHYFKRYSTLKDSVYNSESRNKLFELQTKYDTETKEKENRLLQQDQEIAQKSLQTQRILFYFIFGILLMVFVFTYFAYKNLKKQKVLNQVLKEQKELVEQSRKEILDSITYAKRIQTTILAHKEFIDQHVKANFILYKPKDIVSGDFYWATRRDNLFYLAVCDSTGHGVPGAFMSLLSISFLNEAIGEKNILKPNEVFNYVRQRLIDNISKDGQKDGFDGVLLCMNKQTGEITYASANNRPVVVSNEGMRELNSDRMPVGQGERKQDFTLHTLTLKSDETLYLFTDGYADQFGGPKGKKMMYKRLYQFFKELATKPIEQQSDFLHENFESWRGSLEQVDDVCVIGLRI